VRLELADLIRMNRLVRGGVDEAGFALWADELELDEQRSLVRTLFAYAGEAGFDLALMVEAMRAARVDPSGFTSGSSSTSMAFDKVTWLHGVETWIASTPANELPTALILAAHVFGLAEGRVFRAETVESCNHWWHRDLTDDRVVRALLDDPRYMHTSMKDDARVKGRP
jgi:hypothetical protein